MKKFYKKLDDSSIHLPEYFGLRDMKSLIRREKPTKISTGKSNYEKYARKTKEMLSKKQIKIELTTTRGRPIGIKPEKLKQIKEMQLEGFSVRKIGKELKIPKSTVHYLLKKAKARKIRLGRKLVYLR